MKEFKIYRVNTLPQTGRNGDQYLLRKPNGRYEVYVVQPDGTLAFNKGITDDQNARLERMSTDQISKVESITTGDISKLKEDYTKAEIDTKISDLGNLATSSKINLGNSTVLPVPPQSGGVTIPNAWAELSQNVTYTQSGGSPITGVDGHRSIAEWDNDNEVWELVDMGELPQVEGTDVLDPQGERIPKEKATADYVQPLYDLTKKSNNLINSSMFEAGYISSINGGYQTTDNWIRIPYTKIPNDIKGKTVTAGPFGSVPTSGCAVSFRDSDNNWMQNESIAGNGSETPTFITFTIPLNADRWGFSIVNDPSDGGIGTRPHDNIYVNSFMVNTGSDPIPWEPFLTLLDPSKIADPDQIEFNTPLTENGKGATPVREVYPLKQVLDEITVRSPNLIDTSVDIVRGFWTNAGNHNDSINWVKSVRKPLPSDVLTALSQGQDVYLTISGRAQVPSSGASMVFWDIDGVAYPKSYPENIPIGAEITEKIEANYVDFAVTVGNQPSDGGIGSRPTNNSFTNSFQVEIGQEATPYRKYGEIDINPDKLPEVSEYPLEEVIVIRESATRINVFFHVGGKADIWFRTSFIRSVVVDRFADLWRLNEGHIVRRTGDNFTHVRQVVLTGVWEHAIYLNDSSYNNALGSAHGWETMDDNQLILFFDGTPVNIADFEGTVKCKYFTAIQRSFLKTADGTGNVATCTKKWEIVNKVITVDNNIKWVAPLALRVGNRNGTFMAMCSVMRRDAQGNVTHSAISNDDGIVYDVSNDGFTTPIESNFQDFRRNKITLWGDNIKFEMSMLKRQVILADGTVLPNSYTNAGMYVKNTLSPDYNKLYATMGGENVAAGDFWETRAEYRISYEI